MRKLVVVAAVAASMLPLLFGGQAHAAGALVGFGQSESKCDPQMILAVQGIETAPGEWAFNLGILNAENTIADPMTFCDFIPAITVPFAGEWDPAVGGCAPVALIGEIGIEGGLCLTNPVATQDGLGTVYDFSFCDHLEEGCEPTGTATLYGAVA